MPVLYQWIGNIESSLISPEVVRMILVLKMKNISSNWRYFRFRLFLIVEYNDTRSMSLYGITVTSHERHGVWTHHRFDCLLKRLFSLTTKRYQRAALQVNSPHKGPVMWRSRVRASPHSICLNHCQCSKSPDDIWSPLESTGWHHESWILSRLGLRLRYWHYLIQLTYDQCTMSSGWHTKLL